MSSRYERRRGSAGGAVLLAELLGQFGIKLLG